jgi:hypothetical protein
MKRTCPFLLTVVSMLFLDASIYAVSPRGAFQQASSETAAKSRSEHPAEAQAADRLDHAAPLGNHSDDERKAFAGRVHGPTRAHRVAPSRIPQIPKRGRVTSARLTSLRPQGAGRSADLAKEGLIRSEPRNRSLPGVGVGASRPAAPSLAPARHRGADAVAIGGPPNASRNAAINGTSMKRKP